MVCPNEKKLVIHLFYIVNKDKTNENADKLAININKIKIISMVY